MTRKPETNKYKNRKHANNSSHTIPISKSVAANAKIINVQTRCIDNEKLVENETGEAFTNSKRQNKSGEFERINLFINIGLFLASIVASCITLFFANKSLEAQEQSIKTTQEQFIIENRPILQISEFVENIEVNQKMSLTYKIRNFGKYPAKILEANTKFTLGPITTPLEVLTFFKTKASLLNTYVISSEPHVVRATTQNVINKRLFELYRNGEFIFHMYGEIIYQDEVTKGKRVYTYYYHYYPLTNTTQALINENIDIKPQNL